METERAIEVGPPWVMITVAGVSLLGVVVTAVIGPMIVEWFKSGRSTPESPPQSPESSAIEHGVGGAVTLIQAVIADLQARIGRLETMQMTDAHEHRG